MLAELSDLSCFIVCESIGAVSKNDYKRAAAVLVYGKEAHGG